MRRIVSVVAALSIALVGTVVLAQPAFAATSITQPTANPFTVPGNASGSPLPFTVAAAGFTADSAVFIEQCDGTAPTAVGWDPSVNCDLGTSPAAALAAANGTVTFSSTDANHAFHPFKGISPQGLFNCLSPNGPSPNNGLEDFRSCQLRISTNNTVGTSDQVFKTLTLPEGSASTAPGFSGTPTAATVGQAYTFAFTGVTGSPSPTFALSPATVAGGIHISTAGVLSGTPTTAGSFPITVTASNGVAPNAVHNLTLVVGTTSPARLDCTASGSIGFAPALSNAVPKKPKANKIKGTANLGDAAGAACDNTRAPATATKYPVTSGSVKIKGALPKGSNCSAVSTLPIAGTTLSLKWKGVNPKNGKAATAGKSAATIANVTATSGGYTLTGPITAGPFAGSTLRVTIASDRSPASLLATCAAGSLGGIGFTGGSGPSRIEVL